jgi:hypothetical protein
VPARLTRRAFGAGSDTVSVGIANAISDTAIFVGIAKKYFHDAGLNVTTATFASYRRH